MKHLTKLLATALLALGLNQAVWADDASDFRQTLQLAEQGVAEAQYNLRPLQNSPKSPKFPPRHLRDLL